jgi:hypothetical protein
VEIYSIGEKMSHKEPPEDPLEILRALFRHVESLVDDEASLNDQSAGEAFRNGLLSSIQGKMFESLEPDIQGPQMSVVEGGKGGAEAAVPSESESDSPQPVFSLVEPAEYGTEPSSEKEPSPSLAFDFGDVSQVSVHILSSDEIPLIPTPETERGKIVLSDEIQSQSVLFGSKPRYLRIFCLLGRFEICADEHFIGEICEGQSIDVEGARIHVSSKCNATGHYVCMLPQGGEW